MFLEHYEVAYFRVHKVYYFRGTEDLFTEFIQKWAAVKEKAGREGNNGLRFISKQMQIMKTNTIVTNFAAVVLKN